MIKKQCMKCKRMLSRSEFHKNKNHKDGLQYRCKECRSKCRKERNIILKREIMMHFGSQCVQMDNGVQCSKSVKDNLRDLDLIHPNGDGNEHRNLISNGLKGYRFYRALQKVGYDTGKFVVQVMCRLHHMNFDKSGKKNYNYRQGKFNNHIWLRKRYIDDKKTLQVIADECGVCLNTIRRRMIKFNIQRRKGGPRP